jgi:GT2 family glycosyltransferase
VIDKVYNVTFLVLLYNNEILTSTTLKTLLKSELKLHNCKLVIWNNGPSNLNCKDTIPFKDLGLDVDIKETTNNESLAKMYNNLFRLVRSNKYVILDDDSTLNLSYLQAALNATKYELCVPIITNKSNIKGPKCNEIIVEHTKEFEVDEQLKAIGSGMVIGNKVVSDITDIYGATFDERFYLYGVDFTFCYRVNQIGTIDIRVIQGFEHALSRLLNETALVTKFRLKERSYDSGLQLRYYFPWWKSSYSVIAIVVQHLWKKINKKKTSIIFMDFFRALIKGKHYRDNNG